MANKILFLTLRVFSATGGIEKVCRVAGKAMYEFCKRYQQELEICSLHDGKTDALKNRYLPAYHFSNFAGAKTNFVVEAIKKGQRSRLIVVSHVNLLFPAWCIKKLKPSTKVVLFAHGIEIWDQLPARKKMMLQCVDRFICVSKYTQSRLETVQDIGVDRTVVINNCLDPFLPPMKHEALSEEDLLRKYQLQKGDQVIITLTRIATTEQYKGYDDVLKAMALLENKNIKYMLAGKYDASEFEKIQQLIVSLKLADRVSMPGFIPDEDIGPLFNLATVYAMPSSKEGFGIVFIEAMHYGLPVIGGNADGSVDALLNGALGTLVTPGNIEELRAALEKVFKDPEVHQPNEKILNDHFSYEAYKKQLNQLLTSLIHQNKKTTQAAC